MAQTYGLNVRNRQPFELYQQPATQGAFNQQVLNAAKSQYQPDLNAIGAGIQAENAGNQARNAGITNIGTQYGKQAQDAFSQAKGEISSILGQTNAATSSPALSAALGSALGGSDQLRAMLGLSPTDTAAATQPYLAAGTAAGQIDKNALSDIATSVAGQQAANLANVGNFTATQRAGEATRHQTALEGLRGMRLTVLQDIPSVLANERQTLLTNLQAGAKQKADIAAQVAATKQGQEGINLTKAQQKEAKREFGITQPEAVREYNQNYGLQNRQYVTNRNLGWAKQRQDTKASNASIQNVRFQQWLARQGLGLKQNQQAFVQKETAKNDAVTRFEAIKNGYMNRQNVRSTINARGAQTSQNWAQIQQGWTKLNIADQQVKDNYSVNLKRAKAYAKSLTTKAVGTVAKAVAQRRANFIQYLAVYTTPGKGDLTETKTSNPAKGTSSTAWTVSPNIYRDPNQMLLTGTTQYGLSKQEALKLMLPYTNVATTPGGSQTVGQWAHDQLYPQAGSGVIANPLTFQPGQGIAPWHTAGP